ncbi:probable mediator of RNA polymerase II transcription subunit 26c [Benincasa hispida]|uniref:probable mediator of RNA polymerase II transcription subunit 26c n=1 Tax=Benincasa hispida TaxID=102211 RepID=UPI001901BD60|nr:probable mediator of RNA polymerase II transcription subunit 26c [Benincasa hispida]
MVRLDLDDFRTILDTAGVDVWTFIDTAMEVASLDYGNQLKNRRDGIVERLYALTSPPSRCRNCDTDRNHDGRSNGCEIKQSPGEVKGASPSTPQFVAVDGDDDGVDPHGGLFDDEQKKVLEIKEQLEIPHQPEDGLVELLQNLADMDITFQALKETDIGRHVNRLRKHSSNDVRRLVKHLVRKWKEIVDEWVRLNQPGEQTATLLADGDSPQQKAPQNGYHQVPDFAYSPNPHNGGSGSDRNNSEPEPKGKSVPRRDAPPKPAQPAPTSSLTPQNRQKEQQKEANFDSQKLASARKRLQENYKEAENAKRQRTIQVMDIHEIPKPKNAFFSKNKGSGGGSQGRHW